MIRAPRGAAGSCVRIIYFCLGLLLAPVTAAFLLWRGFQVRGYWQHVGERYGFGPALPAGGLWVHAASVGEVQAAAALVQALRARHPGLPVLLTTFTPTGRERARSLLGDSVAYRFLPFDLPLAVPRFLDRVRPRLAVIVETELWPNLFRECGRRGVPLVLASARVSPKSARRYRRLAALFREALADGIVIAAQSEADAERFLAIGANPRHTHVTGNLKLDYAPPPEVAAQAAALRAEVGARRPVWVAGSTHEGEEAIVLAAHAQVRERHPDALLVLVPRKPQRFDAVADLLAQAGVRHARRSRREPVTAATEVLLVDTLGELVPFYGAADVAFVGGSLVPVGGHNLLEPAALSKPVLTGPCTANAVGIAGLLTAGGAAHVVRDAAELAARVGGYFAAPGDADRDGRRGLATLEANRGSLARVVALVDPLLGGQATT
jgi:3-deoxy-D-manno-octulosonic-acid transferase